MVPLLSETQAFFAVVVTPAMCGSIRMVALIAGLTVIMMKGGGLPPLTEIGRRRGGWRSGDVHDRDDRHRVLHHRAARVVHCNPICTDRLEPSLIFTSRRHTPRDSTREFRLKTYWPDVGSNRN